MSRSGDCPPEAGRARDLAGSFDVVTAIEMLEHVARSGRASSARSVHCSSPGGCWCSRRATRLRTRRDLTPLVVHRGARRAHRLLRAADTRARARAGRIRGVVARARRRTRRRDPVQGAEDAAGRAASPPWSASCRGDRSPDWSTPATASARCRGRDRRSLSSRPLRLGLLASRRGCPMSWNRSDTSNAASDRGATQPRRARRRGRKASCGRDSSKAVGAERQHAVVDVIGAGGAGILAHTPRPRRRLDAARCSAASDQRCAARSSVRERGSAAHVCFCGRNVDIEQRVAVRDPERRSELAGVPGTTAPPVPNRSGPSSR